MTEQPKRMIEVEATKIGQDFQKAAETNVGAFLRSWGELNRGWTAMAAEVNEYSKTVFTDATRTIEQLVGAKTFDDAIQIQSTYAKKAYDNHMAEVSKLGKMCSTLLENAYKQTARA